MNALGNSDYYIGDYRTDAFNGGHRGWIVGIFMEDGPRKTDLVEIKYWEFEIGPTAHETKESTTLECTLILEGKVEGRVADKKITLTAGEYVVIKPGTVNNTVQRVLEAAKGLTIKAPSDPEAKKVVSS